MKKFENIVIASDLDGTYLGKGSVLVPRNLERVRYFCENGGHFTFNTGRLPLFVTMSIPNAAELINMPAITGNGTCLYDFSTNTAIKENFVDPNTEREMIAFVKEHLPEAGLRGCIPQGLVLLDRENIYNKREYDRYSGFMERRILPVDEWDTLNIYKTMVIGEEGDITELYPKLKKHFEGSLQITQASIHSIEVMPYGTNKAILLRETVDRLFGDKAMLCTVGDYDNDLEMHAIADLPVCPSNANERVKSVCKECLCSNNDGVIADLIDLLDERIK